MQKVVNQVVDMICPKTNQPCRHASPARIINIQRVGIIKTGIMERREIITNLGVRCNNDGRHLVSEMDECPVDVALAVPLVPSYVVNELDWAKRHGV